MVRFLSTVLVLMIVQNIPAFSVTVELPSTNDAGIWQNYPNNNYGTSNYLWVGSNNGSVDSLIEFGGLSLYMGANVNEAILELYVWQDWGSSSMNNQVYIIAGSWEESTITWNDNPGFIGDINVPFGAPSVNDWLEVDVSAIVQSWLNGTYDNYGFYMFTQGLGYGGFYCYSKEYISEVYRPNLALDYNYNAVESASLSEIKVVFR